MFPESSKRTLCSLVQKGRVLIDGSVASSAMQQVDAGQSVEVIPKRTFLPSGLKVLFEDRVLVVVEKPAGLLSVATAKEQGATVHALLKRRFRSRPVYPVHRLDRETSGLLVFAYTPEARDHLKKQLERRTMGRQYEALVHGHPGTGTWRCFLREDRTFRVHVCPRSQGKEAMTHYRTLRKGRCHSLLELRLESGRKHQIRVQAADAGYPIVGDRKYGHDWDRNRGLQLRAVGLKLHHPLTRREMTFHTNCQERFAPPKAM